jgi:hypothetical protein
MPVLGNGIARGTIPESPLPVGATTATADAAPSIVGAPMHA